MDLLNLLSLCQGEHSDAWLRLPGELPTRLLTGFVDVGSSNEPPALAALQASYQAVYVPDARISLAWGFDDDDWREREPFKGSPVQAPPPDWALEAWNQTNRRLALVLLNGAVVWQSVYASIDWGSGISGVMPWPDPDFSDDDPTWQTTRWEVELARLLNEIQGNSQFNFDWELKHTGMDVQDVDPVSAARALV